MSAVSEYKLPPCLKYMRLANLAEVIAVYGKGDGQGKQPGFAHQRPGHQIPVMKTLLAQNSQPNAGTEKGKKALKIHRCVHLGIAEFFEKYFYTTVIMPGGIDMSHDRPVTVH